MSNAGEELITYRGVRKRKWGKYVAEIRSGNRSRISLGSYFTPHAAALAYDIALLCLRGHHSTTFNFPDSQFNPTALQIASTNPSPRAIRRAAMAVASPLDTIPANYHCNNDQNIEATNDEAAGPSVDKVQFSQFQSPSNLQEAVYSGQNPLVGEEISHELNDLLNSPEHTSFEESVKMAPLKPDEQDMAQPYDPCWDEPTSQAHPL